ncbi:MAG: tetratricopeptide repeat protein [Candidatus Fermentibacteraceae bacterium]|nr:tetratricopeptide repeat protein [Candidatus Fermentibacteraceae bacterium]MBN2608646.1 tetratricopeptide repeat protein [Candidatus Fermentibacteraceae bacterium]
MSSPDPDFFPHGIAEALEESLSRYAGIEKLLAGRTNRMIEGERRSVAVLFLDLTGFTDLGESVDHEVLHGIVSMIMGFLSSVVESYGGYVDKFEGDRLMALFGARSAAENDSARAVGCAMRMIDVLDEVGPILRSGPIVRSEPAVTARIGIHFGPVTVAPDPTGHVTATGATVNLASRIEEMTEPGRISVSDSVWKECGNLFSFSRLGSFDVRGISVPVPLYAPLGPGSLRLERWDRAARLICSPLVDRLMEREVLSRLLDETGKEPGNTVMLRIRGDAGIGKSRLLHHLMEQARGFRVLHGHAEHYSRTPFWIWIDLLRAYFGITDELPGEIMEKIEGLAGECPDGKLAAKVREEASRMKGLLSLTRRGTSEGSDEDSRSIVVAIRLILDAIGACGDLLLALEDVHWMDEPSWKVLKLFVESGAGPSSTLIAVTERPNESFGDIPAEDWEILDLNPLESREIIAISGHLLARGAEEAGFSPGLLELLSNGARGNPFYAEELVLSLLEIGGIEAGDDGTWRLTMERDRMVVPTSVRAIIQSRVDMLTGAERKVLQLASVIGTSFRAPVLHQVMSMLEPGIDREETIEALVRKGFLVRGDRGSLSFRHDLVQSSVYGTVLRHNRRIVHSLTARAYEKLFPDESAVLAPMIFGHWKNSGERDKVLQWSLKALVSAQDNEQNGEVLGITDTILGLAGEDADDEEWPARAMALEARHDVLARTGDVSSALALVEKLYEESGLRGRSDLEAAAIRFRCILLPEVGEVDRVGGLFELALQKAEEAGDEGLRGNILSSMANHYSDLGMIGPALEHFEKAQLIFTERGMMRPLGSAKANMANLLMKLGRREEAAEEYNRSIDIFRKLGRRTSLAYSLNGLAINRAISGELEEARGLFEEAYEYQLDIGNKTLQTMILNNLGVLTRMLGDYDRSLQYRLSALEMARQAGSLRSLAIAQTNLGNIYRLMEEPDKAFEYCARALETASQAKDHFTNCHAFSIRGMTHLQLEEPDRAAEDYAKALSIVEEMDIKPGVVEDFEEFREMLLERGLACRIPSGWREEG